jgi:ribonuclease E
MTKRMLIDATHAEETRVVVLDGNRLEDFDVETATKKQLKGNIYLAKIVRVEPSLQAAFVEYGGGRHGFLAFGEIHPDYYQIPVADRQRLLAMQAQEAREEEEAEDAAAQADGAAAEAHRHEAPPEQPVAPAPAAHEPAAHEPDADEPAADEPAAHAAVAPETVAPETVEPASEEPPHVSEAVQDEAPATAATADAEPVASVETTPGPTTEPASEPTPEADGDTKPRPAQAALIPQDVRFADEVFEPTALEDHVPGAGSVEAFPADQADDFPAEREDGPEVETVYDDTAPGEQAAPKIIGGENDASDDTAYAAAQARERRSARLLRNYRIQEVIRRRQIILVQVVKEERGNKGAALTTYISLAGRFCVLMPNSPRGGGISRKITSAADRRRLKEITTELDVPAGMGLIVRTAGAARPKPEIKRDAEYLMRLWDDIREHTMKSVAPALIYEEASLIKRSIRDVYSRDVDEILVDGEEGWRSAHDFMRMLMPGHAKKVQLWKPNGGAAPQPLFSKFAVEAQLDAMLSPTVQLKSGGYLVINQTEALVAIDVNSGRSTRERGIEETALRTNLEASDEVARQLRLRDLAGLIVIDYIDMEARKHNAAVERRLTEALKNDRARIQVGHISHFGLMEMSRQRLRPSLTETSFVTCPHCAGAGMVRSVESAAVHVLREIEDEGAKAKASLIMVHCANAIAMYLLNNKRERLGEIEARYAMRVHFAADESLAPPNIRIDRLKPPVPEAERALFAPVLPAAPAFVADEDAEDTADEVLEEVAAMRSQEVSQPAPRPAPAARPASTETTAEAEESARRRRRRRRRGGRREAGDAVPGAQATPAEPRLDEWSGEEGAEASFLAETHETDGAPVLDGAVTEDAGAPHEGSAAQTGLEAEIAIADEIEAAVAAAAAAGDEQPAIDPAELDENGMPRARRRGRRGGRRRRRDGVAEEGEAEIEIVAAPPPAAPAYAGPTPANPFGGQAFDIFDMMDEVESRPVATVAPRASAPARAPEPVPEPATASEPVPLPQSASEPVVAAQAVLDIVPADPTAPEPGPLPASLELEEAAVTEPALPAEPPAPAPVIQPIVIGQDPAPPAAPKKGWWRK